MIIDTPGGQKTLVITHARREVTAWECYFKVRCDDGTYSFFLVWDGEGLTANRWAHDGQECAKPQWSMTSTFLQDMCDYVPGDTLDTL